MHALVYGVKRFRFCFRVILLIHASCRPNPLASRLPVGAYLMSVNDIDVTDLWLGGLESLIDALHMGIGMGVVGATTGAQAEADKWSIRFRF